MLSVVIPSASAVKLASNRCRSTGRATCRTSSHAAPTTSEWPHRRAGQAPSGTLVRHAGVVGGSVDIGLTSYPPAILSAWRELPFSHLEGVGVIRIIQGTPVDTVRKRGYCTNRSVQKR